MGSLLLIVERFVDGWKCSVVFVGCRGDRGDGGGRRHDAGPGDRDDHVKVPFWCCKVEVGVKLEQNDDYHTG